MRRLLRAGLLALVLPCLYAGAALLLDPPGASAALLEVKPGPIDRPLHFTAADFNRDGYDDLAIANFQAGTLTILINQKDGTFAPQEDSPFSVGAASIATPSGGPLFVAAADLNAEDVDSDRVSNVLDNCPNVYNPPISGTAQLDSDNNGVGDACETPTTDSDGDGVPDCTTATGVLDNCPLIPNPGQEVEVAAGADGLCGTEDDNIFLLGDDGICATSADNKVSKVGAACSRSPDLVVIDSSGGGFNLGVASPRVNNRAGGMLGRPRPVTSVGPTQALLADFNADRRPDMLVSNSGSDALLLFPGRADGEFELSQVITTGDGPEGMAAGDFDADGDRDLAVANRSAGTVGLYANTGTALPTTATSTLTARPGPTFLLAAPLSAGAACSALVTLDQGLPVCSSISTNAGALCKTDTDCLGGGTCDSAAADAGTIEVFTNPGCALAGSLGLTTTLSLGPGHRPRGGVLADLDGDCKADLAVADFTGGQVLLYAGDGLGGFVPAAPPALTGLSSPAALALLNYDPDTGPGPDLAVLSYADNRVDLFHNDGFSGGACAPGTLAFSASPTNPASPWKNIRAMSIFAADASVGLDLLMLNSTPPRLDVLSGTGTTFRALPPEPLTGIATASGMTVADLRQDGVLDLLVLDGPGNQVEVVTSELTGLQAEGAVLGVGANPVAASVAPLVLNSDDYDKDGVPDLDDNCPARYNPPACPAFDQAGHPECFLDTPCVSQQGPFSTCGNPNAAGQCDSDADGVGDQCEVLDAVCQSVDSDLDNIPDYSPISMAVDNCPFVANSSQGDTDLNGIGDACDGGICVPIEQKCFGGVRNSAACKSDVDCDAPVNDVVTVNQADGSAGTGTLSFLIGDASGAFRPAPASWSSVTGLSNPVGAAVGHFGYVLPCPSVGTLVLCSSRPQNDIVVLEKGAPGSGDDALKLFYGDGDGVFDVPPASVAPQIALAGDPTRLLMAPDQRVCANPWVSPTDPRSRFDKDHTTAVLAALEPGTSSVGIVLPGNKDLLAPPGNPNPLPVAFPPVDAQFVDLNQDGLQDLIVLSSGAGLSAPNVTIYIGVGNGLFFTDPVLNPTGVQDGMTLLASGNINLLSDATYPDVALFSGSNQVPIILTNILTDRADIDLSGRVDGFDLAVLARAFGAERGENFTILPDGTLAQAGSGATRTLAPNASPLQDGFDLPKEAASPGLFQCDRVLNPMSPLYGLPVDINLDGEVDGKDLALLASRFGDSL